MTTQTFSVRSTADRSSSMEWDTESPLTLNAETRAGVIHTRHGRFIGGTADQVEVVEIDTGAVRVLILPSRGMSIWKMEAAGIRFGWDSPVAGPVHPSLVPLFDPSGIGWLEGFDELVVRCGLHSNGAPEHDDRGHLLHPLHGRIGNLAANSLSIEFDEASGRLEVIGEVLESRLFIQRLRLRSKIRFQAGSADVELLDDVTNDLSQPTTMQLLYHINVGTPILGPGATVEAPLDSLAPKDALSASEIDRWDQYDGPQPGYAERVYFSRLRSDESNLTAAMLRSADGESGLGVSFKTNGLSRFVLWKNTAAASDGYVTGLEPATNFPNTRSFEEKQGRVVEIGGGETKSFRVTLHPLTKTEQVAVFSQKIKKLQGDEPAEIHDQPRPGWSPGA
ncbi:MAG: aldose 1-epimerase family protein [Pirellulales bacterium]|nr:aldose 1-epimerase family protein [Pirellulales bacterium]